MSSDELDPDNKKMRPINQFTLWSEGNISADQSTVLNSLKWFQPLKSQCQSSWSELSDVKEVWGLAMTRLEGREGRKTLIFWPERSLETEYRITLHLTPHTSQISYNNMQSPSIHHPSASSQFVKKFSDSVKCQRVALLSCDMMDSKGGWSRWDDEQ